MVDRDALRLRLSAIEAALKPSPKLSKLEKQLAAKREKQATKLVRQVEYELRVAAKGATYKNGLDAARAEFEKIAATLNAARLPDDQFADMCKQVWEVRAAKIESRGFIARQAVADRKREVDQEFAAIEEQQMRHTEQSGANAVAGTIYSKIAASRPVNRTAARVVSGGS